MHSFGLANGDGVEERFDDGGYSGGDLDRPALQRLMDQIRKRRVQVIVVYKIDRLTRSLADFARLVEILDQCEASFVSVTQAFNTTTSMGRLTLNVLLSFAQFEREVTSERIRDKVAASKRKGMWMGGHPPLGYDILNRRLEVNDREAEDVRRIFRMALKQSSLTALEADVAKAGLRAKRWKTQCGRLSGGGRLTRSSLQRLLRNPVYIGKIRQGGALHDGEHQAIIAEKLWSDVQRSLDDARVGARPKKNARSHAPLAGLLYDDAGMRMVPAHARRGNTVYRYYVSAPLVRGSKEKVGTLGRVSAPRVEREVMAALNVAIPAPQGSNREAPLDHVDRIVLHSSAIEIRLKDDPVGRNALRVAVDLRAAKNDARLIEKRGANQRNEALIKAIALAWDWRDRLERGVCASARALADDKGYTERYVWKILRLGYLAPDIVEAILDGRQPAHLTLHQINVTQLSGDWRSQRRALGFAKPA